MAHAVGPAPRSRRVSPGPGVPRRLLQVITDLNADLDHSLVFGRISHACVELTARKRAAFLVIDGEQAHVAAGVGLPRVPRRLEYSVSAAGLADLVGNGGRHVIPDFAATTRRSDVRDALGPLHTAVLTGVIARGQLVGVLTALYEEVDHRVSEAEGELFDVLAGCGGVAIANSMTYENVVRAEEHHAGVIDGIADGVAVLDSYGLVTAWNKATADLTGVRAVQAIGRPFPLPLGQPGEPTEHDLGEDRWVELTVSPLDEGEVVSIHDISRQKALDAAKTLFVAATSHELKTPLTVIKSFAEWLRGNVERGRAGAAGDGARRDRGLRRGAAPDRREDPPDRPHRSRCDRPRPRAGRTRPVGPGRGRPVRGGRPGPHPGRRPARRAALVHADIQAVRTALGQLLENAFKYSPDGGTVTVTARRTPEGPRRGLGRGRGHRSRPGEIEYLFMAFYQGETRTRSNVRGGVGLGLSIVRRLVEAMGGRVGASGEPGHGSRFWFTLPLGPTTPPAPAPQAATPCAPPPEPRRAAARPAARQGVPHLVRLDPPPPSPSTSPN